MGCGSSSNNNNHQTEINSDSNVITFDNEDEHYDKSIVIMLQSVSTSDQDPVSSINNEEYKKFKNDTPRRLPSPISEHQSKKSEIDNVSVTSEIHNDQDSHIGSPNSNATTLNRMISDEITSDDTSTHNSQFDGLDSEHTPGHTTPIHNDKPMNRATKESTNEGSINENSSFTNETPTKTPIIAISPKLSQLEYDNHCQSNHSPKEKGFFRQLSGRMFGSQSSKNLDDCDSPKSNDKIISRKASHDDNNDVIIKKSNSDIDSPSSRKYNFISIFTKRPSQETLSNNNQINYDKIDYINVSNNIVRFFGYCTVVY
jgi:hypothetical protein